MMVHTQINLSQMPYDGIYKLLTGAIAPRPIGWISTVDEEGQPNLAPFSFFNAVCSNPPTVLFCPMIRGSDSLPKDTLNNVRATGEFVVNIVNEDTIQAMNITGTELPAEVNEFDLAGLTPLPSVVVAAPRVAESPIHLECTVQQIIDIGTSPGGGSIVLGTVVQIHVRPDILVGGDKIDLQKLRPVGRLAGGAYCRVNDIFIVERLPSQIKKRTL